MTASPPAAPSSGHAAMALPEAVARHAARHPDQPALIDARGRAMAYAELDRAAAALAGRFRAGGVGPGSSVLLIAYESVPFYLTVLATLQVGAQLVWADPLAPRGSLTALVQETRGPAPIHAVVAPWRAHLALRLRPLLRLDPQLRVATGHGVRGGVIGWTEAIAGFPPLGETPSDMPAEAPAWLSLDERGGQLTPQRRTAGGLQAQTARLAATLALTPGTRLLSTRTFTSLGALAAGATLVLPPVDIADPTRIDAGRLWRHIERHQVAHVIVTPGAAGRLALAADDRRAGAPWPTLWVLGGLTRPSLLDPLLATWPLSHLRFGYGALGRFPATLIEAAALDEAALGQTRAGYGMMLGPPVPSIELRIVDGQIVLRDAGNSDEAAWLATGDAGRIDEAGRLWLLGRLDERLLTPTGRTLYAAQIEAQAQTALHRDPPPAKPQPVRAMTALALDEGAALLLEAGGRGGQVHLAADIRLLAPLVERIQAETGLALRLGVVAALPMDPRHRGRIDRAQLAAMMTDPGAVIWPLRSGVAQLDATPAEPATSPPL